MSDNVLKAEIRTEFGKGAARRARRAGKVPAVLYGHGTEPMHIALPAHDALLALRQANVLLTIEVEGEGSKLALPKQVQRNPVKNVIEHVDLILVKRGEKVVVEVPIVLVGEPESGALVINDRTALSVLTDPTKIPSSFELSIDGLDVGAQLTAADISLPDGVELQDEPDALVVSITAPTVATETEDEAEGEAAEETSDDASADEE